MRLHFPYLRQGHGDTATLRCAYSVTGAVESVVSHHSGSLSTKSLKRYQ